MTPNKKFEANETILDGDSARRVLYQPSNFIDTTIWDGFTIRNGYGYDHGGGVYLQKNGMVRNCHIHNNTAFDGGGVAAWDNSFVSNCTVSNNKAYAWGGGVFLRRNSILIDCQIFNNTANEKGGVNAASNSIVINCQIFNNTANNDSGVGVFTSAIVTDCQIFNNTSPYSRSVVASDNSTIIANCHIFNNKGGVMVLDGATITDCQIVNNMGGMGASDSSTIANCVLSGHTAENGIGVHNSTMTNCLISNNDSLRVVINHGIITNSTIVKNKFLHINSDDFGEITNSIVWGNDEFILRFLFVTYSVIEGDYQYLGENSNIYISNVDIFVNPSLTTGTSDSTANVDWHLREDAICINRGNNAAVIGSVDLDGNPRIQCDTVDMGCYEYHCSNTGIAHHNHDAATSLHLYPNPTSDLVNVQLTMNNEQLEGVEIQLFDVYGRLLNIVETGRAPSLIFYYKKRMFLMTILTNCPRDERLNTFICVLFYPYKTCIKTHVLCLLNIMIYPLKWDIHDTARESILGKRICRFHFFIQVWIRKILYHAFSITVFIRFNVFQSIINDIWEQLMNPTCNENRIVIPSILIDISPEFFIHYTF
mgnify:CR=1 FL=1